MDIRFNGPSMNTSQGVLGSLLIRLNATVAVYRHNSGLREWPILEVVGFTAITAAVSYLVRSSLVSNRVRMTRLFNAVYIDHLLSRTVFGASCQPLPGM